MHVFLVRQQQSTTNFTCNQPRRQRFALNSRAILPGQGLIYHDRQRLENQ